MKHSVNCLPLHQLAQPLHDVLPDVSVSDPDSVITGLSSDSRTTRKGDLFVATPSALPHAAPGTVRAAEQGGDDGLRHVAQAVERGAAAVLAAHRPDLPAGVGFVGVSDVPLAKALVAAEFYRHPSRRLDVVGITGTNGKTTVACMLRAMLTMDGRDSGMLGTLGAWVGKRFEALANTTPDALEVQRLMAQMVDENLSSVVMEVSSHALMQHRVRGVEFDVGVFTNLSQDHLDYHGDMDAYGHAKARLFDGLGPEATAILNAEDSWSPTLAERTAASVVRFGFGEGARIRAIMDRMDAHGAAFRLVDSARDLVLPLNTRLVGKHNVSNALAAAAAALSLGLSPTAIRTGLTSMEPVPGRLEPVECGQDFRVFVDYAHTPDALDKVLGQLRTLTRGKLHVVFGCGGDRDVSKRPLMGAAAARWADSLFVTSDNPRSEPPAGIVEQVAAGVPAASTAKLARLVDRREAIEAACAAARGGDIVLVAGKGHETTQTVGEQVLAFDDCQVVRETLWKL